MILMYYIQQNVLEQIISNLITYLIACFFPSHSILYNYLVQSHIYDTIKVAITTNGSWIKLSCEKFLMKLNRLFVLKML